MQNQKRWRALRRVAAVGLIAAGGLFSLSSFAFPEGNDFLLIRTYYAEGDSVRTERVGASYGGYCRIVGRPKDWGRQTSNYLDQRIPCNQL